MKAQHRQLLRAAETYEQQNPDGLLGPMYRFAVDQAINDSNNAFLDFIEHLEQVPVSIEEFLDSPRFLGATDLDVWPVVRKAIIEINQYWYKGYGNGAYRQVIATGAMSTAKTTISNITMAYHAHILGCLKSPQQVYGLPSSTSIIMAIQAAKPHVTKKVVYTPLRKWIEQMPWFQEFMRPVKMIESEMYFEKQNIRIVPGGSDADTILGEAVIHGLMDEANSMQVVQKSKRVEVLSSGRAGIYDQARQIYNALVRRRKSRFIYRGPHIGMIIVSSQAQYVNDFTDQRKKELVKNNEQGVYLYDKAQFDVWPADRYCGKKFRLHIPSDAASAVRILEEHEPDPDSGELVHMPIEYWDETVQDPVGAIREIMGRPIASLNPFIRRPHMIYAAVKQGEEAGLESLVHIDNVLLGRDGLPPVKSGIYCQNPSKFRTVHIDLSSTGDRCGIAMLRFDGWTFMQRETGEVDHVPTCSVELAVSIKPDAMNEIDLAEIRAWVRNLRNQYQYPIKAVSYDGWQSLESRQQWRKIGIKSGEVSMDKKSVNYKLFRDALYDGRVNMYEQMVLIQELIELEYDEAKDKVDHPPLGSKDVSDAVCGAYITMAKKAHIWGAGIAGFAKGSSRFEAPREAGGARR